MASCCCWPPERTPAGRRRDSLDGGKEVEDLFDRLLGARTRASAGEPEPEILLDRELGEDPPPLRHESERRRARSAPDGARGASGRRDELSPALVGTAPITA